MKDKLDVAIRAIRDGSSLYWGFYQPDELRGGDEVVEVRLNASEEAVSSFSAPSGWAITRIQRSDTIFMRREQSLDRHAVETMLIETLELAAANGMRFHSWIHGSDLD